MNKKPELIIALQAVAASKGEDLSWLDVGVKFGWGGLTWCIDKDGKITRSVSSIRFEQSPPLSGTIITEMIATTHEIGRITQYTVVEAKQARNDMECSLRFKEVSRDADGALKLWFGIPRLVRKDRSLVEGDCSCVDAEEDLYPSLKPRVRVRLDEIAGYRA